MNKYHIRSVHQGIVDESKSIVVAVVAVEVVVKHS